MFEKDVFNSYCNPLSIPDMPRGIDGWLAREKGMFEPGCKPQDVKEGDYRSISDPTVMYYDNKWYLYPSYGMAWVSENFKDWKHVRTEPYCPKYSPCIIPWKGKFLMTSWFCPLYVADSPVGPFQCLGEFIMPDGSEVTFCDPAMFADEDGRLYVYAFDMQKVPEEDYQCCRTLGYELDQEEPRKIIQGPVELQVMRPNLYWWERNGLHYQDTKFGWTEGVHVMKHEGRYYLIYAAPNTTNGSYCMAVYYSDESPLSGFVCQKKNPLTFHREGIVRGAGHGCVEHGPNGTLWAFYTIATGNTHKYERRIGMDLVTVDENGELYCPYGVTDTPQYIPGYRNNPETEGNSPGLYPLTGWCRPEGSSAKPGRDALYACDESSLTWWEPQEEDRIPTLTCDLLANYDVMAARIFWKENGLDYDNGILPGAMQYYVEGYNGAQWELLLDCRDASEDFNIDYKTFSSKKCTKVRLTLTGWPEGIHPGVIDFAVFGVRSV
ncbi:MAG: family 43 glycosylhydrolase [Roseburia sp.]|nr:family 43 glycosylhydrolase [Roseburia sp.]